MYVGLMTAGSIASRLVMAARSPDTLVERARFRSVEDVQRGDRALVAAVVLGPVIVMVTVGLDHRFGWSPRASFAPQLGAAILMVGALAFATWAMAVNRWFSAVARIQADRAQRVVDTGPYAVVRHPAYAASLLATMAVPVLLESIRALIPAVLTAVAIVVRTAREDRTLREGLPGYEAYAGATRARLIPGVW
jgi:protein-S-isoprenylcysteine O-methyltransferase Ste14